MGNGGGIPLIAGFGVGAGVGIICRYFYSQDYLIPYVDYTLKTDVLIPAGLGVGGILIGLLMKSNTKYLMLGVGLGGISTAAVNYFLPKTETSYARLSSNSNCCGKTIIT